MGNIGHNREYNNVNPLLGNKHKKSRQLLVQRGPPHPLALLLGFIVIPCVCGRFQMQQKR